MLLRTIQLLSSSFSLRKPLLFFTTPLPDLTPADNSLFPKVKSNLKGCRFDTILDIQIDVIHELKSILAAELNIGIQKLYKCASKCIELGRMGVQS
jgi:hypothetical protein